MTRYTILAFMLDRPGVLNKIAMLIRRKNFNVETLTVCEGKKEGVSRMTITVRVENEHALDQVVKQIEKQTEIISAVVVDHKKYFEQELALVKMKDEGFKFLSEYHEFRILGNLDGEKIVQLTGTTRDINNFIEVVGDENIIELARTGVTAIMK
jgi:acetolactate synthase-1/3 small subunit